MAVGDSHAGLVTLADGRKEVVVASGQYTTATQIFSFESQTWRRGQEFPSELGQGRSVPFGDTFLVVGGLSSSYHDTIYKYNIETEGWDLMPQRLKDTRDQLTAFFVPDDYITCTRT